MRRSQLETKYLKKRERRKYYEPLDRKNVLDSKEFWKILSETVFLQISVEKITELYLMILICLKSLALSLKMLLGHSMSSQMNII